LAASWLARWVSGLAVVALVELGLVSLARSQNADEVGAAAAARRFDQSAIALFGGLAASSRQQAHGTDLANQLNEGE